MTTSERADVLIDAPDAAAVDDLVAKLKDALPDATITLGARPERLPSAPAPGRARALRSVTYRLVLVRGMHQSQEPWTFDSAIWTGKEYIPGPTETVSIAWYGGPSPAAKR